MELSADKKKKSPAIDEKYYFILAFVVGCLFMYLFLSYSGLLTTGKYCLLNSDSWEIYVPNIREMCRNILNGQNIYYSWTHSMGMNMSLSLAFYGAFNPINLLYLFFFRVDPNIITAVIIVLKTGLAAMTFQIFASKALEIKDFSSVIFAVFYSMCSFQVSFNIINFIWMDALYMLPLVFLFIYYLAQKGDFRPLCLCYAYLFITQFYMGYVVGIISALFFVCGIWLMERNVKVHRYIIGYLVAVFVSVMISAVVWAPALYFILGHPTTDATAFSGIRINILDVYNQLFFSNNSGAEGALPNLYCGIPALILVPAYFFYAKNKRKEKILYGIILAFVALAFVVPFVYIFLHAFDAPDGWCNRFSWIFSFLLCALSLLGFKEREKIGKKYLIFMAGTNFSVYIVELFWMKYRFVGETINNPVFLAVNVGLFSVWWAFLLCFKKERNKNIKALAAACLLLAGIECVANGYSSFVKNEKYHTRMEEFYYYGYEEELNEFVKTMKEDQSFYRANYLGSMVINSDTDGGYNGISDFETVENENVRIALRHLGVATSPRVVYADGLTPVSDMLLSVKYQMKANDKNILFQIMPDMKPPVRIEELKNYLSLGVMVSDEVKDVCFGENVFKNNNLLISAMTGEKETEVFRLINDEGLYFVSDGINVEKREDGSYAFYSEREGTNKVDLVMDQGENLTGDLAYIYFDNTQSLSVEGSMILSGEMENLTGSGGILSVSYIKQFEEEDDRFKVSIYSAGINKQRVKAIYTAELSEQNLERVYDKLSSYQLEIIDFTNGYLKGRVSADGDKTILFTTIPFDKDWGIIVNGKRQEGIPLLDGAFIGLELPKEGVYEIEMRYHIGWLKEGFVVSVLGLVILAGYSLFSVIKRYKSVPKT